MSDGARTPFSRRLGESKVIAVLRAPHVDVLAPVCDVLIDEGIPSVELTLTTPDLLRSLPELVERYAAKADIGVGTVTTVDEAQRAIDAGADYLVTPTMNLQVVELAVNSRVAVVPGGLTPTELAAGWDAGASAVKIFPAQAVGPAYLRHLHGPFPGLSAIPSGGIDLAATREWLAAGAVAVSLGGPLVGDALAGGDIDQLRRRCRAVRGLVDDTTS
ncbi:bifunctional 4-hydroxy-2-oxoglutarate aldolase/2-dehydro-3-deoxy-phosphogluconate aldolase [Frigoribacterium sp. CFBP 13729]|uniref:bifunctional 4-hydroxy-2-oxoglutarate aldolase/2-dehydro-3-deoxy-phosphogluconate aldolase n=1 Tax=unclassified Frigoribacterium TaxID=2627005 RepID=UPI00177CBE1D|nr:bifunctional 4-hydroxy-2-oxoglutarate aldolase/2-dehydro-3-deoxy-phosphogluconate aldolase [Frigoribacterium sp. CFBP 8766]MBD8610336.1 bifunctional 4-hydroxy-2-oxoglutarate aldolase/2-dehydro-3-deoxy-phosphogluconate aldolase [Frigoribacterium sp. CFBP 13729]